MSTLLKAMGGAGMPPILKEFDAFRRGFSGDAKAEVQKLINSGQISQQQLNEAQAQATQIQQLMKQFGM